MFSGRTQYGQNYRDRPRYNQNYRNDFRKGNYRQNLRKNQKYRGQNYRGDIEEIIGMIIMKEAEVGLEEGSFQIMIGDMTEEVVVDLDQV